MRSLFLAAVAAALAPSALVLLAGCSSSNQSGGEGSAAGAAGAANASSATGYDGALLPVGIPPRGFTLTDQYGRRVSLSDFRGKVTILSFLYTTSRTTAPLIAQQIRGALDELDVQAESRPARLRPTSGSGASAPTPPVQALAISVDPAADTPARVRAFLRAASLSGRMEYLTGSATQLRPVWRAYAAAPASAGAVAYERGALVLLLDREGAPRVEFSIEDLTPEALAHDVRKLEGDR
jgi:protein SCO1